MTMQAPWETDWQIARACLEWQVEMGALEAICDAPIDRYALDPAPVAAPKAAATPAMTAPVVNA
ncbi:MAG: uracil-DNA glycosylase, partial [Roseinatronobacter sp.]